jgi:proline iminopeptidase
LAIDRWLLFGGSWGSTLSLVYAETFPERVLALILRGIFLCRPQEISWFYQEGASRLLPDFWQDFIAPIPEAERGDMVRAYGRRLTGDDEIERMAAAKAWSVWEGRASTLQPTSAVIDHFANPFTALSLARIENHFFRHDSFLAENQILDHAPRLRGLPGIIVHGRYDMVCPLENAWVLHQAWPESELHIIDTAGHSAAEPGITDALIRATSRLGREFG